MLRLIGIFFRIGAQNEMQYRANFFIQLLSSIISLSTGLVGLALVFSHTATLAGWKPMELLAVMGIYVIVGGIIRAIIQPNMQRIMEDIQQGTLDYILTKPGDSQLLVSIRQYSIWKFTDVILGGIILCYALIQLQSGIGVLQSFLFVIALFLGAIIIYSFWLIMTTGAFWLVRIDQIVELFEGIYRAGQWPVGIYPGWLRGTLTFIIPLAFAITVPAESLTGRLSWETMALTGFLTLAFFTFARWFWFYGLRRYSGASA
jgi:ABC-2 type transport system permease protein